MNMTNLVEFEEGVCRKRGNVKNLKSLRENIEMVRYIVEEVLGLSVEEYYAMYSTAFNDAYGLTKYIAGILKFRKEDAYYGKHSKAHVFSLLYPDDFTFDAKKEIIDALNKNDESTLKYLTRLSDRRSVFKLLFSYLEWLLPHITGLETSEDVYEFLSKAEDFHLADKLTCFAMIKSHYYCMLDFYFFHLPRECQKKEFLTYCRFRRRLPRAGLDALIRVLGIQNDMPEEDIEYLMDVLSDVTEKGA